jgi:hypothetical protein
MQKTSTNNTVHGVECRTILLKARKSMKKGKKKQQHKKILPTTLRLA